MKSLILFLSLCAVLGVSSAAKVLGIFSAPSYSHFVIGDMLAKELARRGHEVTVVSTFKPKTVINNYKFIDISGIREIVEEHSKDFNIFDYQDTNAFFTAAVWAQFGYDLTNHFFEHENVQKLLKSNESFDLIMMDHFFNEALYGLCDLFKAPCVALFGLSSTNWSNRLTGNIGMASYAPHMATKYSPRMSFFERFHNLAVMAFEELLFNVYTLPKMDSLLHQYIPNSPPLYDLINNISMVFLNSHPALSAPVPLTSNMKELGGIHIEGLKDVTLSTEIQSFLDKHSEGVIYFALGSNAKSKDIPKGIQGEIIKAFKKWGNPILWKYEEELPDKPDNVKIAKWFPQTAVLAHKNVVAFITHCGRLGSLESLYYGVPMIGLPFFAEQARNAAEMAYYGYAVTLEFKTLKAEDMYKALVEITTNARYTEEAKIRSKIIRKRNALDEAIYWIEHVLEFKGASYLKNDGVNLPWYQFWMVDVVGLLVVCFLVFNGLVAYLILRVFGRTSKVKKMKTAVPKNKKRN